MTYYQKGACHGFDGLPRMVFKKTTTEAQRKAYEEGYITGQANRANRIANGVPVP
jgi:hypothetical protein